MMFHNSLMFTLLTILYLFGIPLVLVLLARRRTIIQKISPMVILYVVGLLVGNTNVLGADAQSVCANVSNVVVLLTIPLMLLGCDYKTLSARMAVKAFFIGLFSVLAVTVAGFFIFRGQAAAAGVAPSDFARVSAVMTGIYLGGIPNMAPVSKAVNLPEHLFMLVSGYDLIVTGLYLVIIVFFGNFIVRNFFGKKREEVTEDDNVRIAESAKKPFPKILLNRVMGLLVAILIAAVAYAVSLLLPVKNSIAVIIISITTFSIAVSFGKPIKRLEGTFDMGLYFVYVFCLAVATMVNVHDLELSRYLFVLYYIAFAVLGSMVLQLILSRLFRVDGDLALASSISLINSPPFVPMVAAVLKNKDIILPGIAIGLLGYAVGNYLGIAMFWLLAGA